MSYCVNCGVELGEDLKRCPLCGTPVINPNESEKEPERCFFPTREKPVELINKKNHAVIVSALLAAATLVCVLLELALRPESSWPLHGVGVALMLWIWFVPPLIWRNMPTWPRMSIFIAAAAIGVLFPALASGGSSWYFPLALPVILSAALLSLVICFVTRGGRGSSLTAIVYWLGGIAAQCILTEYLVDKYLTGMCSLRWSLIVLAVCAGLAVPMLVIRFVPSLREEVRRRFYL